MDRRMISKQGLLRKLVRTAQVRSIVSMLSMLPFAAIAGAVFDGSSDADGIAVVILLFGGPLAVSALLTHFYCKRAVVCTYCGNSLWQCGTGNFKPRRMKIRNEVKECPHCHAEFISTLSRN